MRYHHYQYDCSQQNHVTAHPAAHEKNATENVVSLSSRVNAKQYMGKHRCYIRYIGYRLFLNKD